ncbi:MAG: diguanylate cyclase domain-containing protein [Chloroflexota bacterium]
MIRSPLLHRNIRKFDFARMAAGKRDVAICVLDCNGRLALFNPGAQKLLGWREDELIGKDLHAAVHRCSAEEDDEPCQLREALQARILFFRADDVLRRKDGTEVPVSCFSSPVVVDDQIAGSVHVFHDISPREKELQTLRESEERYRCLAEASPEPMWLTDAFGYITVANNSAARLFGFPTWSHMLQLNAVELFSLDDRPRAVQARQIAARDGTVTTGDFTLVHSAWMSGGATQGPVQAQITVSPVLDLDGKLRAVLYTAQEPVYPLVAQASVSDLARSLTLEQSVALALSSQSTPSDTIPRLLQTVCEAGGWDMGLYWQLDEGAQQLRCQSVWHSPDILLHSFESICRQLSFDPGMDLPGRVWKLNEPVWVPDVVADGEILRALAASKEGLHAALSFPISAGGALVGVMEFLSRDVREPDASMIRSAEPISGQIGWFLERHKSEKELRHQALHDSLTGLPNRGLLLDRLRRSLFVARETDKPLALFLLDLDAFKPLNDAHGHQVGDELLCQVSRRLQLVLRESDTVARLGDDEFAVLLPATAEAGAVVVAGKIIDALNDPFVVEDLSINLSGSMGVVLYPDHGGDASELLRSADAAMYVAKRQRTGFSVYDVDSRKPPVADGPRLDASTG